MKKENNIISWSEYKEEINKLFLDLKNRENNPALSSPSRPYFRGQSDESWELKTTLDRIEEQFSCEKYYIAIKIASSYIESFTSIKWDIEKKEKKEEIFFWNTPDGYEFMAYLRHHGFPSPLLDWTLSPYVAAFFAFNRLTKNDENNVAIFSFIEDSGYGVEGSGDTPYITTLGPTIKTHKRHHLQQSVYTICRKEIPSKGVVYWDHKDALKETNSKQNLLKKYILPISEKAIALQDLDRMNINAYSLFNSEESLMHTFAIRRFFIKRF